MSYDLALWKPLRPLSEAEADAAYRALGAKKAKGESALASSPAVGRAYAKLVVKWVELDDADDPDETPWAARIDRDERHLLLPISRSFLGDVLDDILAIARDAGLDVWDPQTRNQHLASAPAPKPKKKTAPRDARLSPAQMKIGLADAMAPRMAKHGFAPTKDWRSGFVAFARTAKKGIEQRIMFQTGHARNEARLWFGVDAAEVSALLAPTWPWPEPPYAVDAQVLGYYRDPDGRITKNPEVLRRFEYDVCHAACIARASSRFAKDVSEYALPALAALDSVKKLDTFFNADPTSLLPQYVNEYTKSRFVALALATLTGRTDRKAVVTRGRAVMAKKAYDWHSATKPVPAAYEGLARAKA